MITFQKFILFVFFFVCTIVYAEVPSELNGFIEVFANEMRQVAQRYSVATNRLPQKYVIDLQKMQKQYQSEGALDELLAVKNELERFQSVFNSPLDPFETVPEMPQDALASEPQDLIDLQNTYIVEKGTIEDTLKEESCEASDKLLKSIEGVQKELVKQDRLDEAIKIREFSKKIKEAIDNDSIMYYITEIIPGSVLEEENSEQSEGGDARETRKNIIVPDKGTSVRQSSRAKFTPWHRWKYVNNFAFSPDLEKMFSSDIQTPFTVNVREKIGLMTFSAQEGLPPQKVGMSICQWVGSLSLWNVPEGADLSASIRISSSTTTSDEKKGPHFFISTIAGGTILETLRIPITSENILVKIVRDTKRPEHYALFWPKGGISKQFDVPSGASVKIAIGAAISGTRDSCRMSIQLEK